MKPLSKKNQLFLAFPCAALAALACSSTPETLGTGFDDNGDGIADDLGSVYDQNGDGVVDLIDIDGDGTPDGSGVDMDGDGQLDALVIDTDCDGLFDGVDVDGDKNVDFISNRMPPSPAPGCPMEPAGSGGTPAGSGGSSAGSGGSAGPSMLGDASYQGTGVTDAQYHEADIFRNGVGYKFIANGWGTRWQSHEIEWHGTSFEVRSLAGQQGDDYSPAGYPTMFCGLYSNKQTVGDCGLPAAISSLSSVRTGWRWNSADNGEYNAAWDIWLSTNGSNLSSYLMVWLRDPPGQQPAGAATAANATIEGLPGTWTIWTGQVNGLPIVNYVKPEGMDLGELEFDVLDVYNDAIARGYNLPGSHILSVAIGFEVWNGPVSGIVTEDFYVDVN